MLSSAGSVSGVDPRTPNKLCWGFKRPYPHFLACSEQPESGAEFGVEQAYAV